MSKNSVSDFVAAAMDAALKSAEYKTLFNTQYKFASDEGKDKCDECDKEKDHCDCGDSSHAHDAEVEDNAAAWDNNDATAIEEEDKDVKAEAAFDVAIDSLLTASAALDSVGMEKTATFSLKLASLVVEAKKKEEDKKKKDKEKDKKSDSNDARAKAKEKEKAAKEKEKAAKEKAKEKEKRDAQMAKDKAVKDKEKERLAKEKEKAKEKAAKEKAAKEKASKK